MEDFFGPPISSYSRAEAIDDGLLIDVTDTARQAGVRFPCAMTLAAYEAVVAWEDTDTERTGACQDESGRLWDVVWMFSRAAAMSTPDCETLAFELYVVSRESGAGTARRELKAVVGPGDTVEPVITIMLPDES